MPVPTPFHPRTAELCTSLQWKEWAGCFAVRSYDTTHDREYYALRHAAVMLDVSPLYKYEVRGPQAADLLAYVTVRDLRRLKVGRVTYLCWCDDDGKVLDDGTVTRLDEEHFRLTSAEPGFAWLARHAETFDAEVEDVTERLASLALQGPNAREVLCRVCEDDVSGLGFFRAARTRIRDFEAVVTRTGYTGDLGYELWVDSADAVDLWDAVSWAGIPFGLMPAGLDALDVARVEAGFILLGVDYHSARSCIVAGQTSSPFEIGLGWTVQLEREPFIGQAALAAERARGPARATVGLVLDWGELEALYERQGLPPDLPSTAWRGFVPVHADGGQVGRATSGTWSPTLKQNIAIAMLDARHATPGAELSAEVTVEYRRERVRATVVERPFFDPPRKRGQPRSDRP